MMKIRVWHALALLLTAVLGTTLSVAARAADVAIPVRDFFSADAMSRPTLSPSGKYLAVRLANAKGRRQLGVINLDPPRQVKSVVSFVDADVAEVHWVNDDRLVFTTNDLQSAYADGFAPGLYAVDRSGENLRALVQRKWQFFYEVTAFASRELPPNHRLLRVLRDGSADVLIERLNFDKNYREFVSATPLRLNTLTGRTTAVDTALAQSPQSWWVDATGQPLVAVSRADGQDTVHWRANSAAPWTVISSGPRYNSRPDQFKPWTLGADGQLYVIAARANEDRTSALFRFDPVNRRMDPEPVVAVQGFDFTGQLVFNHASRQLLGVRYIGDAMDTSWLNAEMQALQTSIDKRLPGVINLLDVPECGCSRWLLVTSYSDRQSPVYSLYDRETSQLEAIGQTRPKLDAKRMATRDFVRIAARDGQMVPLHITRPNGQGPWPTVMLVHGGPQLRGGSWAWHADSQFLASRGYLVLEPEFRGSTGYGGKLFRAGWKQWGLAMQDDVADAARWAVAQGLADGKRLCIAGASYGGYATLMGLVRDPELYRCGIAWAAVTDIGLLYSLRWSDLSEAWKEYGMPVLIGDPVKDAAQFAATSPLLQAARVTQPLLLAFGGNDRRVPIEHGTRFLEAVRKTNQQVEWIEYPDEGHGWFKPENRYDFWGRVEKFLAKQLAAQP